MFTVRVTKNDEFDVKFYLAVRVRFGTVDENTYPGFQDVKIGTRFAEWCDASEHWRRAATGQHTITILNDRGIEIDRI